mmetsp:Transcript_15852/g.37591  ORF Transcript_15852/g.37591 Transcript_15852/m.37591 type:complete len:118 (-) Transcript_15852:374-727(-)
MPRANQISEPWMHEKGRAVHRQRETAALMGGMLWTAAQFMAWEMCHAKPRQRAASSSLLGIVTSGRIRRHRGPKTGFACGHKPMVSCCHTPSHFKKSRGGMEGESNPYGVQQLLSAV